jgi:hypothetical protein
VSGLTVCLNFDVGTDADEDVNVDEGVVVLDLLSNSCLTNEDNDDRPALATIGDEVIVEERPGISSNSGVGSGVRMPTPPGTVIPWLR